VTPTTLRADDPPAPVSRPDVAGHARRFGQAVVTVAPAWLVARALVAGTLVVAHLTVAHVRPDNPTAALRTHQGLLAWDGGWYQSIATHGYGVAGQQSLRFFPAYPLLGRWVGWVVGGAGPGLLVVSNLCALAGMATLLLLVRHEFGDEGLARRSVWLLALAPPAYTLVMGYAEGVLLLCTTVALLALRTGRWWWAAAAGLVAGAVRPIGLLVLVPVVVEVVRQRRTAAGPAALAGRVAAVVAPVVGAGAYLAWVGSAFGDAWLPFRVQDQPGHRGAVTLPFDAMWHNVVSVTHGHHLGNALHIPWVVLCAALLVVAFRRLPLSYAAFAAAVLAVSVVSSNLDSFERYALSAFPLVIAASTLTSRRGVAQGVLVVAALGMVGYAYLAFLGISVP
jgi:hypothetical protein